MYQVKKKIVYTFKRTEEPDCFVLHFIQMEVGNRKDLLWFAC